MRILLVEDDNLIGLAVKDELLSSANAVDWFTDGQSAKFAPYDVEYDCILLDLGLPKIDGVSLLMQWRKDKIKTPIIILTARDGLDDRVTGLDRGADDYLVKPFDLKELQARIRAVTRRNNNSNVDNVLTNGVLFLNPTTHELLIKEQDKQSSISLTAREFALLEALLIRPGAVLSRAALENRIYSFDEEIESNAVEYIIHTLRKKIGPEHIKNVRGVGWKVQKEA